MKFVVPPIATIAVLGEIARLLKTPSELATVITALAVRATLSAREARDDGCHPRRNTRD